MLNLMKDQITAHEYFNKLGSSINAFTTFDYTSYEVTATDKIKGNITHLLDYVQTPYFTKELIEKERKIILSEVKMGKNNPYQVLYYTLNGSVFSNDNHRYYVTGDIDDVKNITLDEINLVYNTFYHPSNMFLTVTGNFDPEYLSVVIKENQNNKEFKPYLEPEKIKEKEPERVAVRGIDIAGNIALPKLKLAYKIKKDLFGDLSDLEKLLYIRIILNANFGTTSLLKERLLESNLVTKLSTSATIVGDYVEIVISSETSYPNEIIKILKETYSNMDITKKRLERRIRCNIADFIYGLDDIEYTNTVIQDNIIMYGKLIPNTYDIINSLNVLVANKIIKTMQTENNCFVIMHPISKEEQ